MNFKDPRQLIVNDVHTAPRLSKTLQEGGLLGAPPLLGPQDSGDLIGSVEQTAPKASGGAARRRARGAPPAASSGRRSGRRAERACASRSASP